MQYIYYKLQYWFQVKFLGKLENVYLKVLQFSLHQ